MYIYTYSLRHIYIYIYIQDCLKANLTCKGREENRTRNKTTKQQRTERRKCKERGRQSVRLLVFDRILSPEM